mgnify:CR=1 FL=1
MIGIIIKYFIFEIVSYLLNKINIISQFEIESEMSKTKLNINPNSDKDFITKCNIEESKTFPKFLKEIYFENFRHISDLRIKFTKPITVLTGNNRIGKSTILIAIACSHTDFKKRNPTNGKLERFTWGDMMRFTKYDSQKIDWTYTIDYKNGEKTEKKKGQRKALTHKWNGIAKKESQIKKRSVIFLDIDRINPIRNTSSSVYLKARNSALIDISIANKEKIFYYLSYILEEEIHVDKILQVHDKDVYRYKNTNEYSSYNSASGEDVLTRMIIDIVEAEKYSLILIDEIEIGLHPKIQRRLIEVLFYISRIEEKQFIITTHSPTILNAFDIKGRIFLEKMNDGKIKNIQEISINAALTKMDVLSYPLINLYCEDLISKKIIEKVISIVQKNHEIKNFAALINIIVSNGADKAYENFIVDKRTYELKKIRTGYACILDGDMEKETSKYPPDEYLFFLFDDAPEKFMVKSFLNKYPDIILTYHLKDSNAHILFTKMVELSYAATEDDAFEKCWEEVSLSYQDEINKLEKFLIEVCAHFSPDL